jgi:transposase InsO family protein
MERVLKVDILRRGVPLSIFVDNGRVYSSTQFGAACASLGIQRIHESPYSPESKGKQERFFETVRLQFLPEVEVSVHHHPGRTERVFLGLVEMCLPPGSP